MHIARYPRAEIWRIGDQYLVYGRTGDPYITHSEGHAREVAAGC